MLPLLILLYCISTVPLTAALLPYTTPFFLLGIRMTLAGILLLAYTRLRSHTQEQYSRENIFLYAQATIFAITLPYALRYYGLQYTSNPGLSHALYNLGPIITCSIAHLLNVERVTWPRIHALAISSIGFLLYLGNPASFYLSTPISLAESAIVLSIVSFSYGWLVIRKLILDLHHSPIVVNSITMLSGGLLGLCIATGLETHPAITNIPFFMSTLLTIVLISNVAAHTLYAHLLKKYSLTLLQLGYWFIPIVTTLINTVHAHQLPQLCHIAALCLVGYGFKQLYLIDTIAHNTLPARQSPATI